MIALLLLACGGDLTNRVFDEDAAFLAALPSSTQLTLSYPAPAGAVSDNPAELYALNVEAVGSGQALVAAVTAATDEVLTLPPTERGEDWRVWGPTPFDADPGLFLRVEMSRSATATTYAYAFQLAETSAGPWWEYVAGTHVVGEVEVALGSGSIDVAELGDGTSARLEYDLRDGREIELAAWSGGASVLEWAWVEGADGGGSLDLLQPSDAIPALEGAASEELATTSAWLGTGAGRGVARLSGGDLRGATVELVQCWAADGGVLWSWDSAGWTEEVGSEAACGL